MNKNFFWKKAAELKTNTEWYRKTEAEIRERIKETQKILEKEPENKYQNPNPKLERFERSSRIFSSQ